jgi:cytochrome c peroxidase
MLPSDMALLEDAVFRGIVQEYANDASVFYTDFANAFGRLLEFGWFGRARS